MMFSSRAIHSQGYQTQHQQSHGTRLLIQTDNCHQDQPRARMRSIAIKQITSGISDKNGLTIVWIDMFGECKDIKNWSRLAYCQSSFYGTNSIMVVFYFAPKMNCWVRSTWHGVISTWSCDAIQVLLARFVALVLSMWQSRNIKITCVQEGKKAPNPPKE